MRMIAAAVLAALLLAGAASAQTERDYQNKLCAHLDREHVLADGTRVDCVSDRNAIEVDFTNKWAEAIGQALHYAGEMGKRPGVILICRSIPATCERHYSVYAHTLRDWRLPIDTWMCPVDAQTLSDCPMMKWGCDE